MTKEKKSRGRPKKITVEVEADTNPVGVIDYVDVRELGNEAPLYEAKFYKGEDTPEIVDLNQEEEGYQIYTTPHGGEEKIPYSLIEKMKERKVLDGFVKVSTLMDMYKSEITKVFSDGQAENYLDAVKVVLNEK